MVAGAPLQRGVALAAPTLGRPLARRPSAVRARLVGRSLAMTLPGPPEQPLRASVDGRGGRGTVRVCIVGASGKLGTYMVEHALDRGYDVVAVCREQSVAKLGAFADRITIVPGATDDRDVIQRAVAGCDGVLVVLVPRGVHQYASGTAQAVLD